MIAPAWLMWQVSIYIWNSAAIRGQFRHASLRIRNDDVRDLNDLNFYAAVVANGGFSAAARALAVPKSRISRRVAALEAQLGVRLLERSTRRFNVTEVGQDVYRHAR